MKEKTKANIGFEKQIWDAACVLWGHIPASEYRKVIIGLIFLRYISAAFEAQYKRLVEDGDGFEDDPDAYLMDNIFFVPKESRWETIAEAAHTPEIGTVIDKAMRAIEDENKSLKGVLPKNYASPDLNKKSSGMLSTSSRIILICLILRRAKICLDAPMSTALRSLLRKKALVEENSIHRQALLKR